MRVIAALFAVFAAVAASVDVHPLRPTDLVAFHKLSGPVPSSNAQHLLFTASRYSVKEDKTKRSLWLLRTADNHVVDLGDSVTEGAFWLSDSLIGGLSVHSGSKQFWAADITKWLQADNNIADDDKPVFKQISKLPTNIANLKYSPTSGVLAFTAEVYNDGSLEGAAKRIEEEKNSTTSGVVYDNLYVRHWDVYLHPGRRSNLFTVRLKPEDGSVSFDGEPRNLMAGLGLETPVPPFGDTSAFTFSNDGSEIAFVSHVPKRDIAWSTNTDIYIVPVDGSSQPKDLTTSNKGYDTSPLYSPDGKYFAWLQMKNFDRSVNTIEWTSDSRSLIFTADDAGHNKVYQLNVADVTVTKKKPKVLVDAHTNSDIKVVSDWMFFAQHSSTAPTDFFTMNLVDGKVDQRTWFNHKLLLQTLVSDPEEFWFEGARGEKVMGFLWKPVTFHAAERYPLAFLVHGGPESPWNDGWSYRWNPQVWASAGYVVIAINFHGSPGFGQDFTDSIKGHWGGRPYIDLMKGLDFALEKYPFIDPDRMAGLGASYGGYMINWINGHTKRFKCLVTHDGMFDVASSYYSGDELFFGEAEFKGVPYPTGRKQRFNRLYQKWTPARFVHRWATPTLVIHSEKDYRLPVTEGVAVFTALQRRGIKSRFLYFPDENHWVLKPGNSLKWHKEMFDWLDDHVGAGRAQTTVESALGTDQTWERVDESDLSDHGDFDDGLLTIQI
ncbi:Alpha/Beta hydrolase protein [Phlyctochytrium arcticum]|nr:Alpha/Beta hydrolase protein [Phlyctochytrium arcticum]